MHTNRSAASLIITFTSLVGEPGRDTTRVIPPRTDPDGRSLAHPVLLTDQWRPNLSLVRTLAHPWDTRSPALSRVRVE
jgi:hypothetical protein